jgi:hypothetical protein
MTLCPVCNQPYVPVDVHGHVQCSVCKSNIQPCCQGDTCNMDYLEDQQSDRHVTEQPPRANL